MRRLHIMTVPKHYLAAQTVCAMVDLDFPSPYLKISIIPRARGLSIFMRSITRIRKKQMVRLMILLLVVAISQVLIPIGPSIYCYLNSPSFVNGGNVNTTPYFVAQVGR